jgi:hypothetical protein
MPLIKTVRFRKYYFHLYFNRKYPFTFRITKNRFAEEMGEKDYLIQLPYTTFYISTLPF